MESFKIKPGNNRLASIVNLVVEMDFNSYSVFRDGVKISHLRFKDNSWEQTEGELTQEEIIQVGQAIENRYK